jgi:hypothetical protein
VVALRCVSCLPRKRLEAVFKDYSSAEENRYYNVFYWLDFGLSTPRERAVPAARTMARKLKR